MTFPKENIIKLSTFRASRGGLTAEAAIAAVALRAEAAIAAESSGWQRGRPKCEKDELKGQKNGQDKDKLGKQKSPIDIQPVN